MKSYVKQYINTIENQKKLRKDQRMKKLFLMMALLASSAIAVIIVFISIKGIAPFLPNYTYGSVDFLPFITGMTWRQDQGIYGVGFIIVNTLISAFGAMLLSFPISVLTALYIAKIAPKRIAVLLSSVIELLASIPSVVYLSLIHIYTVKTIKDFFHILLLYAASFILYFKDVIRSFHTGT